MIKHIFALTMAVALCACTEESKVKSALMDGAKDRFQSEMKAEIDKSVTGKDNIRTTASKVLVDKTEFEIQRVDIHGDHATGTVQLLTIPPKAREALIEILAKLDEKKQASFNVSNALQLIQQQLQLADTKALMVYKMNVDKTDEGWKASTQAPK